LALAGVLFAAFFFPSADYFLPAWAEQLAQVSARDFVPAGYLMSGVLTGCLVADSDISSRELFRF
jgi:hypothetical protein